MDEFRFANLNWVHAMWLVLLVGIVLTALELRGRSLLDRLLSGLMQSRLVSRVSLSRRLASIAIFCCGLVAIIFGLMRPQWGMTVQKMSRIDSQIMICLDLSKSMLAEDVVPSRLERAKAEIDSLLALLDEGQQVGLIGFAGKATVLCPMTTDFGFLRLILRDASPQNAGMGGTRIGEALQKASDGFREAGDVNRLILLITDGEDHDSFPLDAAEKAKEKGVRVVCVGFGDEIGSKIEVTDPQTGVRRFIKDSSGKDVLSALDGETLREIALKTEGAYVPAGTRALDLQSIYQAHIKTLLKGSDQTEDRVIRNEGYQWCVMAALPLIVLSFLLRMQTGRAVARTGITHPLTGVCVILALNLIPASKAFAAPAFLASYQIDAPREDLGASRDSAEKKTSPASPDKKIDSSTDSDADGNSEFRELEQPPRTLYNMGVRLISTNPDRAEELLTKARNRAGVDGELRYRALFNLSWVELERSDNTLEKEPEKSLQHLEYAAGHLREAVRLRPAAEEARKNLELVMQKILALRDRLAQKNEDTFETRLDTLIQSQRQHQAELQQATMIADGLDDVSQLRDAFRKLGVTQRRVISDMQVLHTDAIRELESLRKKSAQSGNAAGTVPPANSPPGQGTEQVDPQLRMSQLERVNYFLDQSLQSIARARSFTRRSQADRAFLRWSTALTETKRARDQLRNPVELLGRLVEEGFQISAGIKQMQLATLENEKPASIKPAWLTDDYVQDEQSQMIERSEELRMIFEGAVQNSESQENADLEGEPQQRTMLENIKLAIPELEEATRRHKNAFEHLRSSEYGEAVEEHGEAGLAMLRAAELFYNLEQVIDSAYAVETQIDAMEEAAESEINEANWDATLEFFAIMQEQNQVRRERLVVLLNQDKERFEAEGDESASQDPAVAANAGTQDAEAKRAQLERIEVAQQIVDALEADMAEIAAGIKEMQSADRSPKERPPSPATTLRSPESVIWQGQFPSEPVDAAVLKLEELRRLFFTLIEHLRDTAERQAELTDETSEALPKNSPSHPKLGAMQNRESQLQEITKQIAEELRKQGEQAKAAAQAPVQPTGNATQSNSADPQQVLDQAQKMLEAANLVGEGADLMLEAGSLLDKLVSSEKESALENPTKAVDSTTRSSDDSAETEDPEQQAANAKKITETQVAALEKLVEALQLLDQQQDQNDQQQNQDQNQDDQQQDQQEQQDQNQSQPEQQQQMNAEQLLQAIRDREAQRREEKNRRAVLSSGAVEKDW